MHRRRVLGPAGAVVAVGVIAALLAACTMNRVSSEPQTIVLRDDARPTVRFDVKPGPEWSSRLQAGPFVFNVLPQFAIWTEDGAGNLVETLYVTGADFRSMRNAQRNEKQAAFYAECLPVWAARLSAGGSPLPSKATPYPDAVTSATPAGPVTLVTASAGDAAIVYLEINRPGDVNATFTEQENGWVGQPSLLYAAAVAPGSTRLELTGHGGRLRDAPGVYTDLHGFDTALAIVESVVVTIEESPSRPTR